MGMLIRAGGSRTKCSRRRNADVLAMGCSFMVWSMVDGRSVEQAGKCAEKAGHVDRSSIVSWLDSRDIGNIADGEIGWAPEEGQTSGVASGSQSRTYGGRTN